jgi:uncharacterized protein (TIGR00251 family)
VSLTVLAAPKASRNQVEGIVAGTAGDALKVRVTAAPERGKANQAVIKLLAKTWRVPAGTIAVTAGETDRHKTLHIAGDPDTLHERLTEWATTHG